MADLITKPNAWLRTLADADLRTLIDRVPDKGPVDDCRDNYGWQQTIDGVDYRIPVGWARAELEVREQLADWARGVDGSTPC